MATHPPLFDEARYLRLRDIAKSFSSWDTETRDEMIQRATLKLERQHAALAGLDEPFVRSVLWNIFLDSRREKDGKAASLPPDYRAPRPEPASPGAQSPSCVHESVLQMVYAEGVLDAHKLIVDAYATRLEWKLSDIVESLGDVTLAHAAEAFLAEYASDMRPERMREVFRNLYALRDREEGGTPLKQYWDVPRLYEDWVESVREKLREAGGSYSSWVGSIAPHRRLVYLLHEELGEPIPKIIARHGIKRPSELSAYFAREYASRHNITAAEARNRFGAMLECGKEELLTLNRHASPAVACAKWRDDVNSRLGTAVAHQEALAHRQFFEAIPFPHLSMTFLEVSVLKTTPERTVREYYDVELSDWYRRLERRYAEARNLELKLVSERCFRPLRDRLEAVGGKTLGEYIREAGKLRPLFEAKDIVAGWRSEIRRALGPIFGREHPETSLFAWRIGLL